MEIITVVLLLTSVVIANSIGTNRSLLEGKIIGGQFAPKNLTYMVSIKSEDNNLVGGGGLISKIHVLTAAHCIHRYENLTESKFNGLFVAVGSIFSHSTLYVHDILHIDTHDEYTPGKIGSNVDIGVITLEEPVTLTEKVSFLDLPNSDVKYGSIAVLSGWGSERPIKKKSQNYEMADVLKMIKAKIINHKDCKDFFGNLIDISEKEVCALPPLSTNCAKGDSGGPVVVGNTVVGVSYFGVKNKDTRPIVCVNVFKYLDFIKKVMQRSTDYLPCHNL